MVVPLDLLFSKIRVYEEESELWKADHKAAMAFFDFEDLLSHGIQLFDSITKMDEQWRSKVLGGEEEYDLAVLNGIKDAYRWWLRPCDAIEARLDQFDREFGTLRRAEEFRKCHREAVGILTPDEEFFSHDSLVQLRDDAIDIQRKGHAVELFDEDQQSSNT